MLAGNKFLDYKMENPGQQNFRFECLCDFYVDSTGKKL